MQKNRPGYFTAYALFDALLGGIAGYLWMWCATFLLAFVLFPFIHDLQNSIQTPTNELKLFLLVLFLGFVIVLFVKGYYPVWVVTFAVGILLEFGAIVMEAVSFG